MALDCIGEIRSIHVPPEVHVMALSATAARTLRYAVSATIGMRNPFVVAIPPCKHNLMQYSCLFCARDTETCDRQIMQGSHSHATNDYIWPLV